MRNQSTILNSIRISLDITKEMNEELEELKRRTLQPKSTLIRDILRDYLDNKK